MATLAREIPSNGLVMQFSLAKLISTTRQTFVRQLKVQNHLWRELKTMARYPLT